MRATSRSAHDSLNTLFRILLRWVQAIKDNSTGQALYWEPYYAFDGNNPAILNAQPGCVPSNGSVPNTTDAGVPRPLSLYTQQLILEINLHTYVYCVIRALRQLLE